MRITIHTHRSPDRSAAPVLENMTETFGYRAVGVNTIEGVKSHMRASGVDKSVVLGVVEQVRHVKPANDWLISIQDDMLVPFGAIHPGMDDMPGEVRRLREAGIKGVKLHPMVNQFFPDDPKMFPLYEELGDDMVVEIHSGKWSHTGPEDTIYSPPDRVMNMIRQFPKMKVVCLHLGGFYMLDEAERELIGKDNVIIDTTWPPSLSEVPRQTLITIINKHGPHKVCFGTDFPLASQVSDAGHLLELPLPARDKDRILGENARELIGL